MSSRTRPTGAALARAAFGLITAAVLTGCSALSPSSAGGATSTPAPVRTSSTPPPTGSTTKPPAAPDAGTCRNLATADLSHFSNGTPPTSCRKTHTGYTFDVQQLPNDIAFSGVRIENDAVQTAAATGCRTSFARFIGGDPAARALARLTVTYFVPTQKEFDAGAHWVRCDVVAVQAPDRLARLPSGLPGLLDNPDALARLGVCSRGDPGSAAPGLVMCAQPHAFRAVAALRLGDDNSPYPGVAVARTDGAQRCKALMEQLLGPGGGYTYSWTYPTPADWRAEQRFGYCWHKTRS